ncbi:MAG: carboxypeptidase regulatory-like domain-containing protein, partial [Candidatus Binatia bacterium]
MSRQASGAYGSTLDNSLATLALAAASSDPSPYAGAQAALRSAQLPDGSWAGDPFLTALALRALSVRSATPTAPGIFGVVVEDGNSQALAGVSVHATGPQSASATTDANGAFSLSNLATGTYTLQFSKAGFVSASANGSVISTGASDLGTIRLALAPTSAVLEGRVRDGGTVSGIAGATVALAGGGSATTDSGGAYRIPGLAPGAVSITVSATGYQTITASANLVAGATLVFSPSLYPAGQSPATSSISGRVVDAAGGAAIAGASVTAGTKSATTDSNGAFAIAELAPGAISIQVAFASYQTTTYTATLALGANDLGSLAIARVPSAVTISGRVSDRASTLPVAGATVVIGSTSVASDLNGRYAIAGVTQTQFSLNVSAPGYTSRAISVTLPALADSTIDVTLDKVAASGLVIRSLATNRSAYNPYEAIEIEAEVQNPTAQPIAAVYEAHILNAQGQTIAVLPAIQLVAGQDPSEQLITVGANAQREIEIEWGLTNTAPGLHTVVFRAFDPSGSLVAEASTVFTVNAVKQIAGGVTATPPIAIAANGQSVALKATLLNHGNLDIASGPVELTAILENPNTNVVRAPEPGFFPITSGGSLSRPTWVARGADGTLYVLEQSNRQVHKVFTNGAVTPAWRTLNASYVVGGATKTMAPTGIAIDPAGAVYVISTSGGLVVKLTEASPTHEPRVIAVDQPAAIDIDAAGFIYVAGLNGSSPSTFVLLKINSSDWSTQELARDGLAKPTAVAAHGGAYYVANNGNNTVSKVDAQGVISTYASGIAQPVGIVADASGVLYVVASGDRSIRKIAAQDSVSLYAGGTGSLKFTAPTHLAIGASGALFVIDGTEVKKVAQPGGDANVSVFARALVQSPEGLRYDASGNLYAAGLAGKLAKLDAAELLTELGSSLGTLRGVEVSTLGVPLVADSSGGRVLKFEGGVFAAIASGLSSPYGLARNGAGQLYIGESGRSRILVMPETGGATQVAVASMLTDPIDVLAAGADESYVFNATTIAKVAGAGSNQQFATGFPLGRAFTRTPSGGFLVLESGAIRTVGASGGAATTIFSGFLLPLSEGVTTDSSGNAIFGQTNSRFLKTISGAQVVSLA